MIGLASRQSIFGSRRRTEVLIILYLLQESYPSELARLLDARLFSIQSILDDLEDQGVVASLRRGRMRMVRLNPRYFAAKELSALLDRFAQAESEIVARSLKRRARPQQRRRLA